PGKIPSFLHLYEGVFPWFPLSFAISWCWSPWRGCASCSTGRGPATPPRARRHRSPHLHCPSARVSPNPLHDDVREDLYPVLGLKQLSAARRYTAPCVALPKLERSQWYDLYRDMNWHFKYVTEAEVFPEALSQSHGIPAAA